MFVDNYLNTTLALRPSIMHVIMQAVTSEPWSLTDRVKGYSNNWKHTKEGIEMCIHLCKIDYLTHALELVQRGNLFLHSVRCC